MLFMSAKPPFLVLALSISHLPIRLVLLLIHGQVLFQLLGDTAALDPPSLELLFIPHNLSHITNHEPKVNGGRDSPKP
jgi:hypothetical protein